MSDTNKTGLYGPSEVTKIVHKALEEISRDDQTTREKIFEELQNVAEMIGSICHTITSEQKEIETGKANIMQATAELDQVVVATEKATGEIMDACEKIQTISSTIEDEPRDAIFAETMKIFESCSFQDITGQRISKAVGALYEIEQRVDSLIEILSKSGYYEINNTAPEDTREGDERLMNGPQMPDKAMSQEEIDRLLSDF